MNDLLQVAIDAHGGLSRWNQLKRVNASLSITGAIWQVKGKPDILKDVSIEAELHKERLTTHFNGKGIRTVFEPNRVIVETEGGRLVDAAEDVAGAVRQRQTPEGAPTARVFQRAAVALPVVQTHQPVAPRRYGRRLRVPRANPSRSA